MAYQILLIAWRPVVRLAGAGAGKRCRPARRSRSGGLRLAAGQRGSAASLRRSGAGGTRADASRCLPGAQTRIVDRRRSGICAGAGRRRNSFFRTRFTRLRPLEPAASPTADHRGGAFVAFDRSGGAGRRRCGSAVAFVCNPIPPGRAGVGQVAIRATRTPEPNPRLCAGRNR